MGVLCVPAMGPECVPGGKVSAAGRCASAVLHSSVHFHGHRAVHGHAVWRLAPKPSKVKWKEHCLKQHQNVPSGRETPGINNEKDSTENSLALGLVAYHHSRFLY